MGARGLPAGRPVLIARPRFDAWMRHHDRTPMRLVVAPEGYGKTSALLSWARGDADDTTRIVVWITVDAHLAERGAFWGMVLHHLDAEGVPVRRELVEALTRPVASASLLPALLAGQFGDGPALTLIVDSGRIAPEQAVIDDLMRLAGHHEGFRAVIAARELSSNAIDSSLAVRHPAADLLLDAHEVDRIADALGGDFDAKPWFPALRTAVLAERPSRADLTMLGLLPVLDTALEHIRDAGLGEWDDDRFAWHPFLRASVMAGFAASDPDALRRAHAAWATVLHERGDAPRAAFTHALDGEDWPLAARAYRRLLVRTTGRREGSLLGGRRLPAVAVQTQPMLRFATALDDFANGRRTRAMQGFAALLTTAEARHLGRHRPTVDDVWVQAMVMVALRLMGRIELSRAALQRLQRMVEDLHDTTGELDEGRALLLVHGATTLVLSGHLDEAAWLLDDAGVDPLPERPDDERARVLGMRALVAALRGEIADAETSLERRNRLTLTVGYDESYAAFTAMVAGALVAVEHGDADAAARHLERTKAHAATTELWPLLLRANTLIEWQRSGAAAALELLDDLIAERRRRAASSPFALRTVTTLRVRALLALGRHAAAREALADAPQRRSRRWKPLHAQAELLTGDPQRAGALAASAYGEASAPRERLALLMIATVAAQRSGDQAAARRHTSATVLLARRRRLHLPLTVVPAPEARVVLADAPDLLEALDRIGTFPIDADPAVALTAREEVVLRRLVDDATIDEVAATLSVSRNTVKSQVRAIYRKLGVDNRADAVDEARRRHLL